MDGYVVRQNFHTLRFGYVTRRASRTNDSAGSFIVSLERVTSNIRRKMQEIFKQ